MIDEEVHVRAIVFDVPGEHLGISRFEHEFLHPYFIDESRRHLCSPWIDILGDAFALDHDDLSACIEKSLRLRDRPVRITHAFGLELSRSCRAARPELNPDFRFRFHSGFPYKFNEPQPVVCRDRDKAG